MIIYNNYNENRFIPKSKFIVVFILFCLVFFLSPLRGSSQIAEEKSDTAEEQLDFLTEETERRPDLIGRPDIKYGAADFRDPFYPQIPAPVKERPKMEEGIIREIKPIAPELSFLSVQGIIWNADNPLVIINNQVLKREDVLLTPKEEDVTIIDIYKDGVSVFYSGGRIELPSPAILELQKTREGRNE